MKENMNYSILFEEVKKRSQHPNNKLWKQCKAIRMANDFLEIKNSKFKILNLLSGFSTNHKIMIPSQEWIAKQVGCSRVTVNNALRELDEEGLIKKRSRGIAIWNPKTGEFKSHTCDLSIHKMLLNKLRYITKFIRETDPIIEKLISHIPGLKDILFSFFTLMNLFLYSGNIRSNNDYIYNGSFAIKGEYSYEIAQEYKKGEIMPTSTVPKDEDEFNLFMKDVKSIISVDAVSQEISMAIATTLPYTKEDQISRWSNDMQIKEYTKKGSELSYPYREWDPNSLLLYKSSKPKPTVQEKIKDPELNKCFNMYKEICKINTNQIK